MRAFGKLLKLSMVKIKYVDNQLHRLDVLPWRKRGRCGKLSLRQTSPKSCFTNLGSEADLICKQQFRPATTPRCCEAASPNQINTPFTYNDFHRFHTIDLSPQFRQGNFDVVCAEGALRKEDRYVCAASHRNTGSSSHRLRCCTCTSPP
jgi:hypothetical protein